jgi:hypothetical protein
MCVVRPAADDTGYGTVNKDRGRRGRRRDRCFDDVRYVCRDQWSERASDELAETIAAGGTANGYSAGTNPVQIGLGVQVGSVDNVMSPGGVETTANPTDVAIQGDGFLRVANGDVTASPPALTETSTPVRAT